MNSEMPDLRVAQEQLARIQSALAELYRSVHDDDPEAYRVFAEGYVSELLSIQQSINDTIGLSAALAPDFELRLRGEALRTSIPPASVVARVAEQWRRVVARVAWALGGEIADVLHGDRVPVQFTAAADFGIAAVRGGSLYLALSLGPQPTLFPEFDVRRVVAGALAAIAASFASGIKGELTQQASAIMPDGDVRDYILVQAAKLCPTKRGGIRELELWGRSLSGFPPTVVSREAKGGILELASPAAESRVTTTARIGGVDLDKREIILRDRADEGMEISCRYDDDQLPDILDSLGNRVEATFLAVSGRDGRPTGRGQLVSLDQP